MQRRSFSLLLCATLILAGAAVYSLLANNIAPVRVVDGDKVFPELTGSLNDLAWLRLSHGTSKVDFTDINQRWVVVEKGNYPAAAGKVRRLLLGLSELTLVERKTDQPELLSRLDLDDPATGPATGKGALVQLQDRLGKPVADLIVGKTRHDRLGGGRDGVYIRKPGDNQTWLASGSLDVGGGPLDWVERRILDIPASRIASVTLNDGDAPPVVLRRSAADTPFALADMPPDAKLKSAKLAEGPAGTLTALDLVDVKPAADLPVPDTAATATLTTFDGLTLTIHLVGHDNMDWAAIDVVGSGAAQAEAKVLASALKPWSFALPPDRAALLRTKLGDLLEPAKGS
ncbi:MAG: DUF4340 domain-containing protein [Alphaproteobacteria bacterium]|nr:DUF4340 domain-containing protein [Alphaproteobacteria bacterium]